MKTTRLRAGRWIPLVIVVFCLGVWARNSSNRASPTTAKSIFLAHRGVHQDYAHENTSDETCTATHIYPPTNEFIEDTLPAIHQAFADGADVVDFDVHPTTDGAWAVFHDWTLDCRTDGHGVTREQTLAYIKGLDAGFGYTADGGKTYPLRGKGRGLIPSLDEVLRAFPQKRFVIHIKSNDSSEGRAFVEKLSSMSWDQRSRLAVTGGDRPIRVIREAFPSMKTMSPKSLKSCALRYVAGGWTGHVPEPCRNTILIVPKNRSAILWGWPNLFVQRMHQVGSEVFLVADYKSGGVKGINDLRSLKEIPPDYRGGIWTDRIDLIGPTVQVTQAIP